ncbi:MAG: hypothetical protein ACPIOQ_12190, partial [Promethearchaeia archaeon]
SAARRASSSDKSAAAEDEVGREAATREAERSRLLVEKESALEALEAEQERLTAHLRQTATQATEGMSKEERGRAVEKEREMQKAMIRLKQDKELMAQELQDLRNSFAVKAQTRLESLGERTSDSATEALAYAAEQAAALTARLEEAEAYAAELTKSLCDSPHAQEAKKAARPLIQRALAAAAAAAAIVMDKARMRVPALRDLVEDTVGKLEDLSRFRSQAAEAADYWLVWCPLVLTVVSLWVQWLAGGLRMLGLRIQQSALVACLSLAGLAFVLESADGGLQEVGMTPAGVALLHVCYLLSLVVCAVVYSLTLLLGPLRMVALVQLAAVAWLIWCYYDQLMSPTLKGKPPVGENADAFARAHLMRSFVSVFVATWGTFAGNIGADKRI